MRKQELVHIHGLLDSVRKHYDQESDQTIGPSKYIERGVLPTSLHKSKTDHKDAVLELGNSIVQEINKPGSTEASLDTLYNAVLDAVVDQYERTYIDQQSEEISVSLGLTRLTEEQAKRLDSETSVDYEKYSTGGSRLKVNREEAEEWAEETIGQLNN
ncbi:MAG: UPF0058 family protein [Candidatus Nanohaloarchaea archaeon]